MIAILQLVSFVIVSYVFNGDFWAEDATARQIVAEENVFASNRWILNHNVSHYSSLISWEGKAQIYEITALAFIKKRKGGVFLPQYTYGKNSNPVSWRKVEGG